VAVGDADSAVQLVRKWSAGVLVIDLAALIPFWAIKGTKPTGHAVMWALYGVLLASAVIWLGATPWLRARRRPVVAPAPESAPQGEPSGRIGLLNRETGIADVSHATFGKGLDRAIDNAGQVDASNAQFASEPGEHDDESQPEGE
jgi:hypothetical protein